MASSIHHVSCFTDNEAALTTFLQDVVGLSTFDRFYAPGPIATSMFSWPEGNAGTAGTRFGAGPNGLVEVLPVPEELRTTVPPGPGFITFTVRGLDARIARCRQLGFTVGEVNQFDPKETVGLSAVVVTVGGVNFELVSYDTRMSRTDATR